jgi:hypothetical protein
MGLYGNLDAMSVPELLAWVEAGTRSGVLEVEHDKIIKRVMFRDGRIVGCSSNDPATLMGHFLLARGAITKQVLSRALRLQEHNEQNLGQVLLDMGAITEAHRDAFVVAKIEETIYGLFDWTEAVFRFYADAPPDPNALEVDLEIAEVVENGLRRSAERELLREVIDDTGIVLRPTGSGEPEEIAGSHAASRIFGLIDGRKTVKEILLHSHAPEFIVTKFLTALVHSGAAEIAGVRREPGEVAEEVVPRELLDEMLEDVEAVAADSLEETVGTGSDSPRETREYRPLATRTTRDSRELQQEINVALQLLSGGQPEAALELLTAMATAHPEDLSLKQLVINAEKDFCERVLADEIRPSAVPTRTAVTEGLAADRLSAEESFLLEHIDGVTDVKALLWVSPMRDVDALKTLRRMMTRGWLEVRQAA